MKKICYCCFILIFATSCQNKKNTSLAKVWFFQTVDFDQHDNGIDPEAEAANPIILSPETFLNLQSDSSYTAYFGKFEEGKWRYRNGMLYLARDQNRNRIMEFEVKGLDAKYLRLHYSTRGATYNFEGNANNFASESDNPFSSINNYWRKKATAPETDAMISERLRNHFRFWEKYFAWGLKNHISSLNLNNIPSPLQIYGNGFELTHYTVQPYEWTKQFYDSNDCKKAYMKIYHVFTVEHMNWIKTKDRYKMFISAFQQMQEKMK